MKSLPSFKTALTFTNLLFCSASCIAQAPKPEPTQSAKCPEAAVLLTALGNKTLFDQTPEEFIAALKPIVKVEKDVTETGPGGTTSRDINLVPLNGSWLTKGSIAYSIENKKANFDEARFTLSPACFNAPKEFIDLARLHVGKDGKYDKTPPPDVTESLYWRRKDPDINYIRFIELTAAKDIFFIIANRDPSSEGAGG